LLVSEYVCTATLHKQVIWITQGKSNSAVISSTLVQVFRLKGVPNRLPSRMTPSAICLLASKYVYTATSTNHSAVSSPKCM